MSAEVRAASTAAAPITSVLVANRGEIARRVFRTCRSLGLSCVAVYSDADTDAPHVAEADVAVRLPGTAPSDTYLRGDLVVAAALAAGADAVHPGYGFLSERADFARAVVDAGLTWIGPSPAAIDAMGDKIRSKAMVAAAGVPVLETVDAGSVDAASLSYPVLVKASAGGGGRGMRVVAGPDELAEAVASAQREARSAFGDGTVFVERYLATARHVEVQVFGDSHGAVVHLGERECSIQRRHQKIVEEAPSPAVTPALRERMGAAAVAAARAVDYVGAGTVEFLLAGEGDGAEFFFLEMNTRLQVEHPVTELVTGTDLVAAQIAVAQGSPLPPALREVAFDGHAIEARLYAEDVAAGYLPSTGTLRAFEVPGRGPGASSDGRGDIRVDTGVETGSTVSPHYDPMLAKVVVWAPTRTAAARRLATALAGARLHGVTTNRDLLVGVLREPEFLAGGTDTGYLTRHDPGELMSAGAPPTLVRDHAVAAALALSAARVAARTVQPGLPVGWRNVRSAPQRRDFAGGPSVGYAFGRGGVEVTVDGEPVHVVVHALTPTVDLTVDGLRRSFTVDAATDADAETGTVTVDSSLGSTELRLLERHPLPGSQVAAGSLLAPMPGAVVAVRVAAGDAVTAGQTLVVLEAMKMEHAVKAPADGVVAEVPVEPGRQVQAGAVLVVLDPAGPVPGEVAAG